MGKRNRRKNRQNQAPKVLRYSKSGATVVEVFDDESRIVHLDAEASSEFAQYLAESAKLFEAKFGRPMGPNDPIFFDETADVVQPMRETDMTAMIIGAMVEAGIDPAYRYAFAKTGMMLSVENETLFSEEDLDEWDRAYAEGLLVTC